MLRADLCAKYGDETAAALTGLGCKHVECAVSDAVTDEAELLVTTPAYMYDDVTIKDIHPGIRKLVGEVLRLATVKGL